MSEVEAKYLVFGFIAEIESEFSSHIVIPEPLKRICFDYYFICEYFDAHGNHILLNERRDSAWHKYESRRNTIYGNQIIEPSHPNNKHIKIYKWTLKLLGFKKTNGFYLGIDSSDKQYLNESFARFKHVGDLLPLLPYYAFTVTKYLYSTEGLGTSKLHFNVGDIVCLILNVEEKTFKIIINNNENNVAKHQNVVTKDVKYRLAVTLTHADHKVQLIKYETMSDC